MTYKIQCPGCNTHTTENTRGFVEEGKCPTCGLSLDALHEIQRVRQSHATEEVKAQFEELATRAAKAAAQVRRLTRKLDAVRDALEEEDD